MGVGASVDTSGSYAASRGTASSSPLSRASAQEGLQPRPLGGAELVAQAPQVGADEVGREREALGRGRAPPPRGRPGRRSARRVSSAARARRAPRRARAPPPRAPPTRRRPSGRPVRSRHARAEVGAVGGEGRAQPGERLVADQQHAVHLLAAPAPGGRSSTAKGGGPAPSRMRSRATEVALCGVTATRPDLVERHPREELDRVDRAVGGDRRHRHQAQPVGVARVRDARHRRHVEPALEQGRVERGGHAVGELQRRVGRPAPGRGRSGTC